MIRFDRLTVAAVCAVVLLASFGGGLATAALLSDTGELDVRFGTVDEFAPPIEDRGGPGDEEAADGGDGADGGEEESDDGEDGGDEEADDGEDGTDGEEQNDGEQDDEDTTDGEDEEQDDDEDDGDEVLPPVGPDGPESP